MSEMTTQEVLLIMVRETAKRPCACGKRQIADRVMPNELPTIHDLDRGPEVHLECEMKCLVCSHQQKAAFVIPKFVYEKRMPTKEDHPQS